MNYNRPLVCTIFLLQTASIHFLNSPEVLMKNAETTRNAEDILSWLMRLQGYGHRVVNGRWPTTGARYLILVPVSFAEPVQVL